MKINYKNLLRDFFIILGIILLFTFFDYLVHLISHEYSVPTRYFPNKILYGTIFAFISYLFVKNKKPLVKSLIISLITVILLQIRYFLEGYSLYFVILFLFIHFIILFITSFLTFKLLSTKNKKGRDKLFH
jgi:hypothetical protein